MVGQVVAVPAAGVELVQAVFAEYRIRRLQIWHNSTEVRIGVVTVVVQHNIVVAEVDGKSDANCASSN